MERKENICIFNQILDYFLRMFMVNKNKNNSGLTLIEIMIGVLITSIMMAAMYTSYNVVNQSYSRVSDKAKISKSSRDLTSMIMSDLRMAGFKYRPWKGVYCSNEFLESEGMAQKIITNLLKTYKQNQICPLIETNITTDEHLKKLSNIFNL